MVVLGEIEAIFRYPVKSMRGESLASAELTWHGIPGDRRHAVRRIDERGGFPWLSASKLAELVLYTPQEGDTVRTPDGATLPLLGDALAADIGHRHGAPVEIMGLRHGIYDETPISVITSDTVREVCRLAGTRADVRRFRPNILVRSVRAVPFEEDSWVGGTLVFGDAVDDAAVAITMRDERCVMLNIDPDDASRTPEMMKAVVRVNENHAGVYATVTHRGRLAVGQTVTLR